MLRSIQVRNFRRRRDLVIEDLSQINLLVGANNAGKTSLLEAIWLLCGVGDPTSLQKVASLRDADATPELLWPGLFSDGRMTRPIDIRGIETDGYVATLRIAAASAGTADSAGGPVLPVPALFIEGQVPRSLDFSFSDSENHWGTRTWRFGEEPQGPNPALLTQVRLHPAVSLAARRAVPRDQLATAFTYAFDQPTGEDLITAMRALEPGLENLSLGYVNHEPVVRAHVGLERPIPLNLLGEGSVRLLEILIAFPLLRHGVVLIDEVENGFYYQSLNTVWRAISTVSRAMDVQVFATTHGLECIDAAVATFREEPDRFRMHRLDATDDGVRAVTYDVADADTAAQMKLEVR